MARWIMSELVGLEVATRPRRFRFAPTSRHEPSWLARPASITRGEQPELRIQKVDRLDVRAHWAMIHSRISRTIGRIGRLLGLISTQRRDVRVSISDAGTSAPVISACDATVIQPNAIPWPSSAAWMAGTRPGHDGVYFPPYAPSRITIRVPTEIPHSPIQG